MQTTTQIELVNDWAKIAVETLQKEIDAKKIIGSGALRKSFIINVIRNAAGDASQVSLMFNYYGRFVDMGVGRGHSLSLASYNRTLISSSGKSRGNLKNTNRDKKKWYSRRKTHQIKRLGELLGEYYNVGALDLINSELSQIEITIPI